MKMQETMIKVDMRIEYDAETTTAEAVMEELKTRFYKEFGYKLYNGTADIVHLEESKE